MRLGSRSLFAAVAILATVVGMPAKAQEQPPVRVLIAPVSFGDIMGGERAALLQQIFVADARSIPGYEVTPLEVPDDRADGAPCATLQCALPFASAMGAEALVVGSVEPFGKSYVVLLRRHEVPSGRVVLEFSGSVAQSEDLAAVEEGFLAAFRDAVTALLPEWEPEPAPMPVAPPPPPPVALSAVEYDALVRRRERAAAEYHRHIGFFLRFGLHGGLGFAKLTGTPDGGTQPIEGLDPAQPGFQGGPTFAIGGCVIENLPIYAVFGAGLNSELVDLDGSRTIGGPGRIGIGASYYFMPYNVYVGGQLALVLATLDEENTYDSYRDRTLAHMQGAHASVHAGIEWWLSANWGMGLGLEVSHDYAAGDGLTLNSTAMTIFWSTTYN